MPLKAEEYYREFLATQSLDIIASQILRDKASCQECRLPTLLALYLPSPSSDLADAIASKLFPETASYPKSVRMAQYNGTVTILRSSLQHMTVPPKHEQLSDPVAGKLPPHPSEQDIETTLDVLNYAYKFSTSEINLQTPLADIIGYLRMELRERQLNVETENTEPSPASVKMHIKNANQKKCYICQYMLFIPHRQYSSLCKPCGDYNLASSALSAPGKLHLHGKTALVTGGRVNLGYHVALRLLRCGARVIVSTRYPRDAESRYLSEPDSSTWGDRLKFIGADFRAASDVFQLLHYVKEYLRHSSRDGTVRLDILVNNAAQTLTDLMEKEKQAVIREAQLLEGANNDLQLSSVNYSARIRGVLDASKRVSSTNSSTLNSMEDNGQNADSRQQMDYQTLTTNADNPGSSSWLQSIHQIPYEDVVSAHSVNTFVPLILIRELLPIMKSNPSCDGISQQPGKASAYIINVSSREGIFESSPKSAAKNGKHVHTNLTKAALNMLTETEAGPAWKYGRVAINTVDPGFMSAAPEIEKRWKECEGDQWTCPIGWEDGAGRVLWPIAVSENGKDPIWGRFLKHFGAVEIDVSVGR